MSRTAPLPAPEIRVLWPARSGPQARPATARRPQRRGGGPQINDTREFAITLPASKVGPFTTRRFRYKVEFGGGATLKIPMSSAGDDSPGITVGSGREFRGQAAVGAKIEQKLNDVLSVEAGVSLNEENFNQVCDHIAAGNWRNAMREIFSAKISAALVDTEVFDVNAGFEVSPDSDACFFGLSVEFKMEFPVDEVPGLDDGTTVSVAFSPVFRFGPTPEFWRQVAQRIGRATLRGSLASLSEGARNLLSTSLGAAGFTLAVVAGGTSATLMITQYFVSNARADGDLRARLQMYSTGYVARIQAEHRNRASLSRRMHENRYRRDGWRDAGYAISRSGAGPVERILKSRFSSGVRGALDENHERTGVARSLAEFLEHNVGDIQRHLAALNTGAAVRTAVTETDASR